ncbi:hypothetical protein [Demequina zhanjiangensis]|uniref:Uncharacterized protein n=1 Tax=Demequina zhanjiangensis TaxID=3051659 RepID=A0ABT8FY91_9MICO|nr:hypothetical protein [Demequina sp. SYSU T00b26]MDN4471783.1 hypothetical protein [Demequina sp. SYSU T00b26]
MRLRTTALIAGLFGVIALIVGLVAQQQRPETTVTVGAPVGTAAVIVPADMLAFAGTDGRYAVDGAGTLLAFSALPGDLEAWASSREVTYVTGMPTWESLTTTVQEPEPDPSASPSASPEEESSPSPSPSVSADAGPQFESLLAGSADLWRQSWTGTDRLSVGGANVEPGLELMLTSEDGSPLTGVDLTLSRDVNDAWVAPLIVWGGILTAIGVIALVLLLIDVRPVQARAEEWMAHRQRIGTGDAGPKPGSRRARRLEGAAVPEAELAAEPDEQAGALSSDSSSASDEAADGSRGVTDEGGFEPPSSTSAAEAGPTSPAGTPFAVGGSAPGAVTSAGTPFAVGGSAASPSDPRSASTPSSPSAESAPTPSGSSPEEATPGTPPSAGTPSHDDFLPPAQADEEDDR